VTLTPHPLLVP